MRRTFYITGNPLVKEDSIPLRIMPRLQNEFPDFEFRELEPTDSIPEQKELDIIDTVIGLDKVQIITDVDKIVTGKVYSLHDFDLGFNLKLMKKTGTLKDVNIIGIPAYMKDEEVYDGVKKAIKSIARKKEKAVMQV